MTLITLDNATLDLDGTYFVTGTDTEIGKTTITSQLIKTLAAQGKSCYAIKPVTAGLEKSTNGETYSDDARRINQFATVKPPISALAPIQLSTPSSPHIAAHIDGVKLQKSVIVTAIQATLNHYPADVVLIEGAGGWFTPINEKQTLADVAIELKTAVIMVVGIKLGCLNHALLTLSALWQAGLTVAMVVFNQLQAETEFLNEQIAWLVQQINAQSVQYQPQPPILVQQGIV